MTLAAWKKGVEVDPLIRITVPESQHTEYNRLIGMMRAAGGDISLLINTVSMLVEQVEIRFGWLFTLRYWAVSSALVLELLPRPSARVRTLLETAPLRLAEDPPDLRLEPEGKPDMADAAAALVEKIRQGVQQQGGAVAALELVLDELSADFDGEDLLHEEVRATLDAAKATIADVAGQMAPLFGEIEYGEPDPNVLECARKIVKRETA